MLGHSAYRLMFHSSAVSAELMSGVSGVTSRDYNVYEQPGFYRRGVKREAFNGQG